MKYFFLILLSINFSTCFGQLKSFKQIIYDNGMDTSCFKILTKNELKVIETQKYRHKIDSSRDIDFEGNRAKLNIESVWVNETVKEEHINKKPASCNCYYEKDTLFIQINCTGGGGYAGISGQEGLGFDIKVIGNNFTSNYFQWNSTYAMYKDRNDSIKAYTVAKNKAQELKLKKIVNYKENEIIYGTLKYKTDTIYLTNEKILKNPYHDPLGQVETIKEETYLSKGLVTFKCDKLKKRNVVFFNKYWKIEGKKYYILKAPYHIFDNIKLK